MVTLSPLKSQISESCKNRILVWPGVGSACQFQDWSLDDRESLRGLFDEAEKNIAICLGFQMLFGWHEEGSCEGLKIFPGTVRRLAKPHLNYEIIDCSGEGYKRLYFNHSYYIDVTSEDSDTLFNFSGKLGVALRQYPKFLGCQFHPEKSGEPGIHLIEAFLR